MRRYTLVYLRTRCYIYSLRQDAGSCRLLYLAMNHAISSAARASRYDWVDFAKGLCIAAVVALWVHRTMDTQAGWLGYFVAFAKPFRMPDFFLISGLFLSRVIDRPWKSYLDTKVVHYAYFLVLWTLIIIPGLWLLKGSWPHDVGMALRELAFGLYKPVAMLWFLMMLAVYFVVTRLLRHVSWKIVLPVSALMMMFPFHTGIYPLDWFGEYFVFFYAGHKFSERFFQLADWTLEHPRLASVLIAVWAVFNAVVIKLGAANHLWALLVLGFLGVSALVMLSALLSRWPSMRWLNRLGQNSIVVYLGFYLIMVALVDWVRSPATPQMSLHMAATVVWIGSILGAVLIHQILQRTPLRALYERPAWARL